MALIQKALLQTRNPIIVSKRFRGKINIQKPRPPHFEKQLLLDFAQPVFRTPNYLIPQIARCDKDIQRKSTVIDNPFERILARECLDWFNKSKMVIFLHLNSISMEDQLPLFATLKRNNMHLRTYGRKIVNMATTGTRYEAVNTMFVSHQRIIFGQPENLNKLFKILKKTPQLVVMAGIIQDRLMSKNELVEYSQLPSLDMARSQLCSVLLSAGSSLVGNLQQSQQLLVGHLDKHVEISSPTDNTDIKKEDS